MLCRWQRGLVVEDPCRWIETVNWPSSDARTPNRYWRKRGLMTLALKNAFADIRREDFLGPGPWPVVGWGDDYVPGGGWYGRGRWF